MEPPEPRIAPADPNARRREPAAPRRRWAAAAYLVGIACALVVWQYCREYRSRGHGEVRITGRHSVRVVGYATAGRAARFSPESPSYAVGVTLPDSTPVYGGARVGFVTRRKPAPGVYRIGWPVAGWPAEARMRAVFFNSDWLDGWDALDGTVRITTSRWWSDAIAGTFRVRFVQQVPVAREPAGKVPVPLDTIVVTGTFETH